MGMDHGFPKDLDSSLSLSYGIFLFKKILSIFSFISKYNPKTCSLFPKAKDDVNSIPKNENAF